MTDALDPHIAELAEALVAFERALDADPSLGLGDAWAVEIGAVSGGVLALALDAWAPRVEALHAEEAP